MMERPSKRVRSDSAEPSEPDRTPQYKFRRDRKPEPWEPMLSTAEHEERTRIAMMPMFAQLERLARLQKLALSQGRKEEENDEAFTPEEGVASSQDTVHSASSAATVAVPLHEHLEPLHCTRCGPTCLEHMLAPLNGPGVEDLQCTAEHGCEPRCCRQSRNPGEEPDYEKAWAAAKETFVMCGELTCDAFGCSSCMVENTAGGMSQWFCGECFFSNLPRLPPGWDSDETRRRVRAIWQRKERMCWPDCKRRFANTVRDPYSGAPRGARKCDDCRCWCCSKCMVHMFEREFCPGCLLNEHRWHPLTQHLAESKLRRA